MKVLYLRKWQLSNSKLLKMAIYCSYKLIKKTNILFLSLSSLSSIFFFKFSFAMAKSLSLSHCVFSYWLILVWVWKVGFCVGDWFDFGLGFAMVVGGWVSICVVASGWVGFDLWWWMVDSGLGFNFVVGGGLGGGLGFLMVGGGLNFLMMVVAWVF